jgi:hypothetical protein
MTGGRTEIAEKAPILDERDNAVLRRLPLSMARIMTCLAASKQA